MSGLTVSHVMQAWAEDAVDLARERFEVTLDYSEESLPRVERCLAELHDEMPGAIGRLLRQRKTDAYAWNLAKLFGGYLGEVIRRRWGGQWVTEDGEAGRVIVLQGPAGDLHPTTKVYQRPRSGADDAVTTYYKVVRRDLARLAGEVVVYEPSESELRRPAAVAAKTARRPPSRSPHRAV